MILFLADNHYGNHPGRNIYDQLKNRGDFDFHEDDLTPLASDLSAYDLLMLNVIPETPGSAVLDATMIANVKSYLESGKPLFLLHGSSALIPQEAWWRDMVGLRWVRGNDPWGVPASTHPKDPFTVALTKSNHPLINELREFEADDELYIQLEHTAPIHTLMQASWDGKSWPQCYVSTTIGGGKLAAFIPGHRKDIVESDGVIENVNTIIQWCLEKSP